MPRLYDLKTGKPVDIGTADEATELVKTGKYFVPEGTRQAVRLSDGRVGKVDANELADAVRNGATFIGDEGYQEHLDKKKYEGGLKNTLVAGAEGAARGATFGLSDVVGKIAGAKEHLAKEKKYNETAATGGEILGAVAPALFGDEAGVVGAAKEAEGAVEGAVEGARGAKALAEGAEVAEEASAASKGARFTAGPEGIADAEAAGKPGPFDTSSPFGPAGDAEPVTEIPSSGTNADRPSAMRAQQPPVEPTDPFGQPVEKTQAFGQSTTEPTDPFGQSTTEPTNPFGQATGEAPPGSIPGEVPPSPAGPQGPSAFRSAAQMAGAPVRAVSDLGEAASHAAVQHLAEAGYSPIWQRIAGSVARGAVEAPIYQIGHNISEEVLGDDKNFVASHLLAGVPESIVFGAAAGGALEGALSVAGKYMPPSLKRAGSWLERVQARLDLPESQYGEKLAQARRNLARLDDNAEAFVDYLHKDFKPSFVNSFLAGENARGQAADEIIQAVKNKIEGAEHASPLASRFNETLEAGYRKISGASNDAERMLALDEIKSKMDKFAFAKGGQISPAEMAVRQDYSTAAGMIRKHLEDENVWGKAAAFQKEMNSVLAPYYNARTALRSMLFEKNLVKGVGEFNDNSVRASERKLGTYVERSAQGNAKFLDEFKRVTGAYTDSVQGLGKYFEGADLGKEINVEKLAHDLEAMHGGFDEAVAARKADQAGQTKAQQQGRHLGWDHIQGTPGVVNTGEAARAAAGPGAAASASGGLKNAALGGLEGVLGVAEAAMRPRKALRDLVGIIRGGKSEYLANMAGAAAKNAASISEKLDGFLNGKVRAPIPKSNPLKEVDLGTKPKRGETPQESYQRVTDDLVRLHVQEQSTPGAIAQQVKDATPQMGRFAPQTQAAFAALQAKIVQQLVASMPKNPVAPFPGDKPFQPSDAARSAFAKNVCVALSPATYFEHMAAGTNTPEMTAMFAACHPELYAHAVGQATRKTASMGLGKQPYQKRVNLSVFQNAPTHASLMPQQMAIIQSAYSPQGPEKPKGGSNRAPRAPAIGKIDFASSSSTKFSGFGGKKR